MAEFVIMPKLGFNMDQGQLVGWRKKEGETIEKGEVIFEITTDKTNMEIESTISGVVLKILVEAGETVPVTLPIGIIGKTGEDISGMIAEANALLSNSGTPVLVEEAVVDEKIEVESECSSSPSNNLPTEEIRISPRARKYAVAKHLVFSELPCVGTGFESGVCEKDLLELATTDEQKITPLAAKIAADQKVNLSQIVGTGAGGKITRPDVDNLNKKNSLNQEILEIIPYKGMRKVIGDRLSISKFTAPHLYFTATVDMSYLEKLRKEINEKWKDKASFNDFIIVATTKAVVKYPEVNCALIEDEVIRYKDVNIGMAVAIGEGLIVPVLRQTQQKTLKQIALEAKRLGYKAKNRQLAPSEYQGGTFTVSNLGMFGIENFTAIINPPEAAILAVSATKRKPIVVETNGEEQLEIRSIMNITLSIDHRLIDGLTAVQFVNEIKQLLEEPLHILT